MNTPHINEPMSQKPLRLWPGVVAVILQWLLRFVLPLVVPDFASTAILAGLAGGLAVLIWWLFFSRAPWLERLGVIALMVLALVATSSLVHVSIANGMMGMMLPIFAIPLLSLALVASAALSRRSPRGPRLAAMAAAILFACGLMMLIRTNGITGDAGSDLEWRWTPTAEQRLLARAGNEPFDSARVVPTPPAAVPVVARTPDPQSPTQTKSVPMVPASAPISKDAPLKPTSAPVGDDARARSADKADARTKRGVDWPGFRGRLRDSIVRNLQIETDWTRKPPIELWRRPIGPGWSSFAVHGDLLYTQEQRGDGEIVACYKVSSGEPVWKHSDPTRFWESNGGAGPRATPTLKDGRVYTFGATGILNALDAASGAVVWSRNVPTDTGAKTPGWGFSSSPLVVNDLVVVHAKTLAAYDLSSGEPRWSGPARGGGYSSPHLLTIDGVEQILMLSGAGATSVAPVDGAVLWEHSWSGTPIIQPALIADGDLLISTGGAAGALGMRRIAVAHGPGGWTVEERWTSIFLKPYFNDFVIHKGHAFGFDGSILACIDIADGTRKWKGGRYGHGQLVLLPEQDLLLVLSEEGELALIKATPDGFAEVGRFPAIESKTWNHPVLAGDVLLVRNGEEMAAFRLALAGH